MSVYFVVVTVYFGLLFVLVVDIVVANVYRVTSINQVSNTMSEKKKVKKNRLALRQLMQDYRLGSVHVADLLHTTDGTIRTYCSNYGADISTAHLELLELKVGAKQTEGIKHVSISK